VTAFTAMSIPAPAPFVPIPTPSPAPAPAAFLRAKRASISFTMHAGANVVSQTVDTTDVDLNAHLAQKLHVRKQAHEDEIAKRQQSRLRQMAQEEMIKKKAAKEREELEEILGEEIRSWAAKCEGDIRIMINLLHEIFAVEEVTSRNAFTHPPHMTPSPIAVYLSISRLCIDIGRGYERVRGCE
jgi:hypothetical protein